MQNILILLSVLMILFSLFPLVYKINHLGIIIPTTLGCLILTYTIFYKSFNMEKVFFLKIIYYCCILFYVLLFLSIFICLCFYKRPNIDFYKNGTLIVLGCKIRENRPSRMLKKRLNKALVLLKKYENLNCIVSGGQGSDEDYAESFIMKKYLIEHGINKDRIFEENKSTNTFTNLFQSNIILEKNSLNENVIIVSDSFHLFRAYLYSKKLNMNSSCVACSTNILVWFSYMFREMLGIIEYFIKYRK